MHEYNLGIDGLFALPVSLVRETVIVSRPAEGPDADPAAMQQRLEDSLRGSIDGEIVSRSFSVAERDGAVYVTMRARRFENIARVQEITQAEAAPP